MLMLRGSYQPWRQQYWQMRSRRVLTVLLWISERIHSASNNMSLERCHSSRRVLRYLSPWWICGIDKRNISLHRSTLRFSPIRDLRIGLSSYSHEILCTKERESESIWAKVNRHAKLLYRDKLTSPSYYSYILNHNQWSQQWWLPMPITKKVWSLCQLLQRSLFTSSTL